MRVYFTIQSTRKGKDYAQHY